MRTRISTRVSRHVPASALRAWTRALLDRLARGTTAIGRGHRRVAGRVSALERVMRRAAVHDTRAFTTQVRLLALLPARITRHTGRMDVRQAAAPEACVQAMRRPLPVLVSSRVLHQRLFERLVRTESTVAVPCVSLVTRAERHQAAPRLQLIMVRAQAPQAKAATALTEATAAAAGAARAGPSPTRVAPPSPPLVLPAQELSRLTEHVIRQLDHRVLSWQERTGHI